jgi:C1A family cysteine protease
MDAACDYLKANGVPDEQCLPYKPEKMKCSDTCPDWKDRVDTTKILDWAKTIDVNAMKTNLVENGPQITGMAVYNDFFSYSSGVYRHVTGDLAGYHCITAVGFDDDEECWICKNSWGEDWGETGFFKIGYGECGIDDVFGMWDMKVPAREPDGVKEGYADQISIEYSCESSVRVLNAYAGGEWRQCQKTDADLMEIAKLAFGASKVYVGWKGSQLIFMRCFKSG